MNTKDEERRGGNSGSSRLKSRILFFTARYFEPGRAEKNYGRVNKSRGGWMDGGQEEKEGGVWSLLGQKH